MNILYITSSFIKRGSASVRNISLVNGLIENGHEVDVLTQKWPTHMNDSFLEKNINPKVKVYFDKIRIIDLYFNNITLNYKKRKENKVLKKIKEIVKYLYYFPDIDKEWIFNYNEDILKRKYDLIISSSDTKTAHLVANKILKRINHKSKWFQIWGDPWVDDKGTTGIRRVRAFFSEKKLISKADKVLYVSKPTLIAQKNRYKKYSEKMIYLRRSYFTEIISSKKIDDKEIIFSYIGSIYYGRNIEPILEAIKKFNKHSKLKIIVKIYGTHDSIIELFEQKYDFVKVFGHVNYGQVERVTYESDALIFLGNYSDSNQIPGKLFDYFGTNRAILAVLENMESDVAKFIKETNRCILIDNKQDIDIELIVKNIMTNKYNCLYEYSKEVVADELIKIYKNEIEV